MVWGRHAVPTLPDQPLRAPTRIGLAAPPRGRGSTLGLYSRCLPGIAHSFWIPGRSAAPCPNPTRAESTVRRSTTWRIPQAVLVSAPRGARGRHARTRLLLDEQPDPVLVLEELGRPLDGERPRPRDVDGHVGEQVRGTRAEHD